MYLSDPPFAMFLIDFFEILSDWLRSRLKEVGGEVSLGEELEELEEEEAEGEEGETTVRSGGGWRRVPS